VLPELELPTATVDEGAVFWGEGLCLRPAPINFLGSLPVLPLCERAGSGAGSYTSHVSNVFFDNDFGQWRACTLPEASAQLFEMYRWLLRHNVAGLAHAVGAELLCALPSLLTRFRR
jgi:hypothetical protein